MRATFIPARADTPLSPDTAADASACHGTAPHPLHPAEERRKAWSKFDEIRCLARPHRPKRERPIARGLLASQMDGRKLAVPQEKHCQRRVDPSPALANPDGIAGNGDQTDLPTKQPKGGPSSVIVPRESQSSVVARGLRPSRDMLQADPNTSTNSFVDILVKIGNMLRTHTMTSMDLDGD